MWKPSADLLEGLISMGISKNVAERALLNSGNRSVESAVTWVFDNPEKTFPEKPVTDEEIEILKCSLSSPLESNSETDSESEELPESYDGPYKMVFVVNMELGMGVGKIAAQVAHSALGIHRLLIDQSVGNENECGPLTCWEDYDGEKKIALKGENKQHLLDLMKQAEELGLPCYLVRDAGHTQVTPGSSTVLSIFGKESDVNRLTGKLKLL